MGNLKSVIADYKKFVKQVEQASQEKVDQTVTTISDLTNSKYRADGFDDGISLTSPATGYTTIKAKDRIDGIAYANESKELIYLEFGTRRIPSDKLDIRADFKSGIDTIGISLPYKVNGKFKYDEAIRGRYYFLDAIDQEGVKFIKDFGK